MRLIVCKTALRLDAHETTMWQGYRKTTIVAENIAFVQSKYQSVLALDIEHVCRLPFERARFMPREMARLYIPPNLGKHVAANSAFDYSEPLIMSSYMWQLT